MRRRIARVVAPDAWYLKRGLSAGAIADALRAWAAEGADHILGYRSPNFVYRPPHAPKFKLLLKNYRLSDEEAAYVTDHCDASVVFVDAAFAPVIDSIRAAAGIQQVVLLGDLGDRCIFVC